jgi:putative GTP pyrophosphokinase
MRSKRSFLERYNIDEDVLSNLNIDWDTLCEIERSYSALKPELESVGRFVVDALLKCDDVHSINFRLKDNEHLVEKIIRKLTHHPERTINIDTYREQITDLVGVRALHLFKEDWLSVHEYIRETWKLVEKPLAYVRAGDSETIVEYYRKKDCEVREHPFGYRSVHYLIESCPNRQCYVAEIQARTVFEEAWGEIDHVVRYPYDTDNELIVRLSSILNRLAANADELGTYMMYLKQKTAYMEKRYADTLRDKNESITRLQQKIDRLEIDDNTRKELAADLTAISENPSDRMKLDEDYPWLDNFFESDLFRSIAERVDSIVSSDEFKKINLSETDLDLLSHAQSDLVRLMQNPRFAELLTEAHNSERPLLDVAPQLQQFIDDAKTKPE